MAGQYTLSTAATRVRRSLSSVVERGERRLLVTVEEHLQLPHGDAQVRLVEGVGDVPTEGPVFAPLLQPRVEKAEAEEHLAPDVLLLTLAEEFWIRDGVG
eukprot:scaffold3166_cov111-Isochrysis_galbana.AAC.4